MAIYPIVDGQTVANLGSAPKAPSQPAAPTAAKVEEDSLIDFGGEPDVKQNVTPANDVEQMLQDTGKPAEGSLIDL